MTGRPGPGTGRAGERPRPVTQLVAATANPDKLAELNALLTGAGIEVLPRPASVPDVVEDGDSLEANARLKAVAVAAVSVGIIGGVPLLDLPYVEDSVAEVDFNVVMTGAGRFVEVQGTAEGAAFSRAELDALVDLAAGGIAEIVAKQQQYLAVPLATG